MCKKYWYFSIYTSVSISCWLASVLTLEPTDYGTVGGRQVIATGQPVLGLFTVTSPCSPRAAHAYQTAAAAGAAAGPGRAP